MNRDEDLLQKAGAGDLHALRLLILTNLEPAIPGDPVPVDAVETAICWAREACVQGNGEDGMRLFWLLLRRKEYPDGATDAQMIERVVGEAMAVLTATAWRDDDQGRLARSLMPDAVAAMRAGAVFHTRLLLDQWSVSAEPFEAALSDATTPPHLEQPADVGDRIAPQDLFATLAAQSELAARVAAGLGIDWIDAAGLVADVPDAAEKLKSPAGWRDIADQVADRIGSPTIPTIAVTVN